MFLDATSGITSRVGIKVFKALLLGDGVLGADNVDSRSDQATFSPGTTDDPIGTLTVDANLDASAGLTYELDLGNPEQNDVLAVTGDATLSGTLDVSSLVDSTVYQAGDAFNVLTASSISGEFTNLPAGTHTNYGNLPSLDDGLAWELDYSSTALTLTVVESGSFATQLSGVTYPVSAVERLPFSSVIIADVWDDDPSAIISVSDINWGDGTTSAATLTPDGTGGYYVIGSHTYLEEGTYYTVFAVGDGYGDYLALEGQANVADALLAILPGNALAAFTGSAVNGVVARFTDPGSDNTLNDYSSTVAWGMARRRRVSSRRLRMAVSS